MAGRIINLTPHPITVYDPEGREVIGTIPPSGAVVRLATESVVARTITVDGAEVPIARTTFGAPEGVPTDLQPGDVLVVSTLALPHVAAAVPPGVVVMAPDPGPASAVRDADGRIVGVRRFQTV